MWHEARKQERKIRGIMVDYKRRAERRQQYYEKMRLDPHQLLRIYGQKCKMHLSVKTVDSMEEVQLVPWQGNPTIKIDRFDVRSHLDAIDIHAPSIAVGPSTEDCPDGQTNYERYRSLVQIEATGVSEEAYLKQLEAEEVYGKQQAEIAKREREKSKNKASIGYTYEDSTILSDDESDDSDSDSELSDIDITVDVNELTSEQKESLDNLATQYGISSKMYCQQLMKEKKEIEFAKQLEEEENERSKLSGRRGKRARRTLRERQKARRETSPPSFAVRESPTYDPYSPPRRRHSSSSSSSRGGSPKEHGKIEFITEFVGAGASPTKTIVANSCDDSGKSKVSDQKQGTKERKGSSVADKGRRTSQDDEMSGGRRRHSEARESRVRHSRRSTRSRSRSRSRSHSKSQSRYGSYRRRSRSHSKSRDDRKNDNCRSSSSIGHQYRSRESYSRSRSGSRSRERSDGRYRSRSPRSRSKERSDGRSRSSRSSRSRERSDGRFRSSSPMSSSYRQSGNATVAKKLETSERAKPLGVCQIDKSKITPQEKLKLRMAKLLNKQIKDDKKEEVKKKGIKEKERVNREMEMLEIQRKRRQREREQYLRNKSPDRSPSPSRGWRKTRPQRENSSSPL